MTSDESQRQRLISRRDALGYLCALTGAGLLGVQLGCKPSRGDSCQPKPTPPACRPTAGDIQGPFYLDRAPHRARLAGPDEPGKRITIHGRVLGPDCQTPLPNATMDLWQADAEGRYDMDDVSYRLRGVIKSNPDGRYAFESIMPGRYRVDGSQRPAHIHCTLTAPGYAPLTTQIYFAGDPFLMPDDPCVICDSGDAARIVTLRPSQGDMAAAAVGMLDLVLATAS